MTLQASPMLYFQFHTTNTNPTDVQTSEVRA